MTGEAGIGKTALLRRGVAEAELRGFEILRAQPAEGETDFAFAGLSDLLAGLPPAIAAGLPEPQRRSLDVALLRADPDRIGTDRRAIAEAVLSCLRALAAGGPVLVAIDDAPWLDRSTADSLAFALRRLGNLPVGVLVTARSVAAEIPFGLDRLPAPSTFSQARPRPLSLAGLQRTIRARLGRTFSRPILARIEHDSAGNPFYALQIAEALVASGRLPRAGEDLPVADTLERLVAGRVARAPGHIRPAIEAVAILGNATYADVQALCDSEDVAGLLQSAVDQGLIESAEGGFAFAHPLIAAAVYASTPVDRRRLLHRRAADVAGDPEARARHLAGAATGPDEIVAVALDLAAERSALRGAPDGAAGYAALACQNTDPGDDPAMTARRTRLGAWQFAAGDPVAAERTLRSVVEEAPPGRARAVALMERCWIAQETAGYARATELGEAALMDVADDPAFQARIHADVSRLCDHDVSRKLAHAEAAMAIGTQLADPGQELITRACLALAEARFFQGQGLQMELIDRARAAEPPAPAGRLMPGLTDQFLAWILGPAGDTQAGFERRLAFYRAASAESPSSLPRALGWLTSAEIDRADWAAAERHAHEHLDATDWGGGGVARAWPLSALASVHALVGRIDEARVEGTEALALAAGSNDVYLTLEALKAQASIAAAIGDSAAVVADLTVVDDHCEAIGIREPALIRHHPGLIEALIATGDLEAAGTVLSRFDAQTAGARIPWAVASVARARGLFLAAQGDPTGALDALDRAVAVFDAQVGMPFELARTLLARGIVQRRADRRRLAANSLAQAVSIFERLGATPWLTRARKESSRVPVRRTGGQGLTPTEAQVAGLAATGQSNREIASAMFIGVKTVEANLTRVYAKLGVRSRAGIAGAMAGSSDNKAPVTDSKVRAMQAHVHRVASRR